MMDEEKTSRFIEVVHNNECLWSVTSKAYKNNVLREDLWKSIGVQFEMTGDEAYGHFKSLREKYRREKDKEHSKSGAAASKPSKWSFFKSLEFLDEAYKRLKVSNSQSWCNSTANKSIVLEIEEDNVSVLEPQSPQLESPPQEKIKHRSVSRSRSKTQGGVNVMVEAMNNNTAKMLDALETNSPIDNILSFLKDTYNELEQADKKDFELELELG